MICRIFLCCLRNIRTSNKTIAQGGICAYYPVSLRDRDNKLCCLYIKMDLIVTTELFDHDEQKKQVAHLGTLLGISKD